MNYIKENISRQKSFKKVITACQHLLYLSDKARNTRNYLNSRLTKEQQLYWKFGYFPNDENLFELLSLVSKEELEELNLYYPKYISGGEFPHGHFSEHNLVLPFYNEHNEVISLLGRSILNDEQRSAALLNKYKYSSGVKKELFVYGLNKAKESIIQHNCVVCVEGQFDCISLHNHGITNTIALGWANVSKYQFFQIHRYTNNIILMLDNDEAGQKSKDKIKIKYKDHANIKTINPPKEYKDIDEFFRLEKNEKYINSVIDLFRSIWRTYG